jgi:hypothetical protein
MSQAASTISAERIEGVRPRRALIDQFSEVEMAAELKIPLKTLRSRRSRGTNHPPYRQIGRDVYYPKDLYEKWLNSYAVVWEVRHVS